MKRGIIIILIAFLPIFPRLLMGGESSDKSPSSSSGTYNSFEININSAVDSGYSIPPVNNPQEIIFEFLELNRKLLGVEIPRQSFVFEGTGSGLVGTKTVWFAQVHHKFRIHDTGLWAEYTQEGELSKLGCKYYYDIDMSTDYSIDSTKAVEIAIKDVGSIPYSTTVRVTCPARPAIYPSLQVHKNDQDKLYLVWPVTLLLDKISIRSAGMSVDRILELGSRGTYFIDGGLDYRYDYFIDAMNGNVLRRDGPTPLRKTSPIPR